MILLGKILAFRCYHVLSFEPEKCFAVFQCTASNNIKYYFTFSQYEHSIDLYQN